jgi:radical SAM protein with 4Fe4S-binding SPASM domain
MMIDTLKAIRYGMGNPIARSIIKFGMNNHSGGSSRLDKTLEAFAYGNTVEGFDDHLYYVMFETILNSICKIFSVKPADLAQYLKDPVTRRGVLSVLKGIATYGVTKPQLLNAPFLVVWNFTNLCNLRCKHCYQKAGQSMKDELSLEEKLGLVDELASAGVVAIAFSGGEPLTHPDLIPTIIRARQKDLYVSIATNGVLLTLEIANRLKEIGVGYMEVSLDSPRPEIHDAFRGVKGSWKRTTEGIKNSVEADIFTVVASTITQLNFEDVTELIDLAESFGASRFIHFNFIPSGRGREIIDLDLTPQQREDLLKLLYKKSQTSKIEVLSTAPQFGRVAIQESCGHAIAPTHFYLGKDQNWGLKAITEFIGGCGAARLYCAIQPNGDVTPCVFIPQLIVGNVKEHSFPQIWHTSRIFKDLQVRSNLKGNCSSCKYNKVCGGCRARALAYFQDYMAPDIGCINNIEAWENSLVLPYAKI